MSHVLLIAGMHRSGTSLTANWLQQTGLHIGDDLLVTYTGHANPSGKHFEDRAFLAFHKKVLTDNGYDEKGFLIEDKVSISPGHVKQAEAIIRSKESHHLWGWKEPRTTLLLDFWRNLLPEIKVLAIYRHPDLVVDSIIRRALDHPDWRHRLLNRVRHFPLRQSRERYYQVWNRYNREIIDFYRAYPTQTVVLEINDVLEHGLALITYLNERYGFTLQMNSPDTVFIKSRLTKPDDISRPYRDISPYIVNVCKKTYNELNQLSKQSSREFESI